MLRRLLTLLLLSGFIFPVVGWALGLGKLETYSHLNEPVKAQAKLVGLGDIGLSNVSVSLAKPQLFQRVGVSFSEEALKLRFKILRATDGSPYVEIYSDKPVSDPNVPFLLQLTWPGGNLLRQYTLLLNPEEHTLPKSKKQAKTPANKANVSASSVTKAGKKYYGPTTDSDRLWAIATHHRPDPIVSTPQTAIAIFLMNPTAFRNAAPSDLKQGVILVLPGLAVAKRIPDKIARQILNQKAVDLKKLQQQYGITPVDSNMLIKPQILKRDETNVKQTKPINKSKQAEQLTQQVLHLAEQKNHQLEVQLLALQTKYNTLEKKNQMQAKRISDLHAQLKLTSGSMNKSESASSSKQSTKLQQINRQLEAKLLALERQHDMLKLASQEQVKRITALQEKNRTLLNQGKRRNVREINTALEEKTSKATPKKTVPIKKTGENKSQTNDDPILSLVWLTAIGIIVIAILYWFWTKWRALPHEESGDQITGNQDIENEPDASVAASIVFTKGDLGEESSVPPTSSEQTVQGETLTSHYDDTMVQAQDTLEQTESSLDVESHDAEQPVQIEDTISDNTNLMDDMRIDDALASDPIEEADVYLAYDRFEQAEKVLLKALEQKPDHHSWRIKLLAVYSKMQDINKFNQVLTQIPQLFLDQHPDFSEQVRTLMKTVEVASDNQSDFINGTTHQMDEGEERVEVTQSDLDTDFFPEEDTLSAVSRSDNTIPFTPGLGVSLSEDEHESDSIESLSDDEPDIKSEPQIDVETLTARNDRNSPGQAEQVQVTVAEVLAYAEQLIEEGDTSTAEKLLTKAYYQGTPEERDKARQLLDNL